MPVPHVPPVSPVPTSMDGTQLVCVYTFLNKIIIFLSRFIAFVNLAQLGYGMSILLCSQSNMPKQLLIIYFLSSYTSLIVKATTASNENTCTFSQRRTGYIKDGCIFLIYPQF